MANYYAKHLAWCATLLAVGIAACTKPSPEIKTTELPVWESSTMQSGSIYYDCNGHVTLDSIQKFLAAKRKLQTLQGEWQVEGYADLEEKFVEGELDRAEFSGVQVRVVKGGKSFLIQIDDSATVLIEAKELAVQYGGTLSAPVKNKLSNSACRIDIGNGTLFSYTDASGAIWVNGGVTNFDISNEPQKTILRDLTVHLDGLLWDNVNGGWWTAP